MNQPKSVAISLDPDNGELLARALWEDGTDRILWSQLEPLAQHGLIEAARDWIIRVDKLRGSSSREVELVPTTYQPRVELDDLIEHPPFPDWDEVAEPYALLKDRDRFVVFFVVGIDPRDEPEATTPEAAAASALDLTREEGKRTTVWHVYDRRNGRITRLEQRDFEDEEVL